MSRYDEFPYRGGVSVRAHPWRIGALARLHGLTPPAPEAARVLELGCGDGINLLSIAKTLPGSRCLGIDVSAGAIAEAEAVRDEAGIDNCELRVEDLLHVGSESLGAADYVIAHGLISWVPGPVRERALELAAAALAPGGLLFVSYNALPGWHGLAAAREIARAAIAREGAGEDPLRSQEAAIAAVGEALELHGADDAYAANLRVALGRYGGTDPVILFHDDFAALCEPLALADVADAAAAATGLAYLGEAAPEHWWSVRLSGHDAERIRGAGSDAFARQKAADLASGVTFKTSVFVKGEAPDSEPDPLAALALHVRPLPEIVLPTEGMAPAVTEIAEAVAALGPLGGQAQAAADSTGIAAETAGAALLRLAADGRVDLTLVGPTFSVEPGERPRASALARVLATRGELVPTLTHEYVRLGDDATRALLQQLDGDREHETALVTQLEPLGERGLLE